MATWADYDNDAWLDVYTGDFVAGQLTLLRNLGAAGGFAQVTATLNMPAPVAVFMPTWGDYDNDGWLDLFVAGDYSQTVPLNALVHNNRDGTFTQILNGSPVHDGGRRFVPSWTD